MLGDVLDSTQAIVTCAQLLMRVRQWIKSTGVSPEWGDGALTVGMISAAVLTAVPFHCAERSQRWTAMAHG